jgi:hypothetical protein
MEALSVKKIPLGDTFTSDGNDSPSTVILIRHSMSLLDNHLVVLGGGGLFFWTTHFNENVLVSPTTNLFTGVDSSGLNSRNDLFIFAEKLNVKEIKTALEIGGLYDKKRTITRVANNEFAIPYVVSSSLHRSSDATEVLLKIKNTFNVRFGNVLEAIDDEKNKGEVRNSKEVAVKHFNKAIKSDEASTVRSEGGVTPSAQEKLLPVVFTSKDQVKKVKNVLEDLRIYDKSRNIYQSMEEDGSLGRFCLPVTVDLSVLASDDSISDELRLTIAAWEYGVAKLHPSRVSNNKKPIGMIFHSSTCVFFTDIICIYLHVGAQTV